MKAIVPRKKAMAIVFAGLALFATSIAQAYIERRIENGPGLLTMCDSVPVGQRLCADLQLGDPINHLWTDFAQLNVTDAFPADSRLIYNSRLSVRCSNNALIEGKPRNCIGTTCGDVTIRCNINNVVPLRIEGALDKI